MTDEQHYILQELEKLGETPEEVAESLSTKGITGLRCDSEQCPVARFVKSLSQCLVSVGPDFCNLWNNYKTSSIPLPEPVSQFVKLFDEERISLFAIQ